MAKSILLCLSDNSDKNGDRALQNRNGIGHEVCSSTFIYPLAIAYQRIPTQPTVID